MRWHLYILILLPYWSYNIIYIVARLVLVCYIFKIMGVLLGMIVTKLQTGSPTALFVPIGRSILWFSLYKSNVGQFQGLHTRWLKHLQSKDIISAQARELFSSTVIEFLSGQIWAAIFIAIFCSFSCSGWGQLVYVYKKSIQSWSIRLEHCYTVLRSIAQSVITYHIYVCTATILFSSAYTCTNIGQQ